MAQSICESVSINDSCVCNVSFTLNECLWEPQVPYSVALVVIVTFCYVVIFLLAFLWNTFVIAIFIKDRYLLQEPSSLFLFLLAVVDLLEAALSIPFYVAAIVGGGWIIGNTDTIRQGMCTAIGFIFSMFLFTTVHLLAVISFDRFLYIVHSLKYRKWMSLPRALCLLAFVSIIPLVLASLPLFGFGELGYSPLIGACSFRWQGQRQYVILVAVEGLIPIIATVVFTLWTYIYVKRFLRRRHIRQKSIDMTIRNQRVDRTLTQTFLILLVSQAVCFTPGIITAIVGFFVGYRNIPSTVFIIDLLIIISSVAINPIIQSLFRTQIRRYLIPPLHKIWHKVSKLAHRGDRPIEHVQDTINGVCEEGASNTTSIVNSNPVHCKADQSTLATQNKNLLKYVIDPINGTLV